MSVITKYLELEIGKNHNYQRSFVKVCGDGNLGTGHKVTARMGQRRKISCSTLEINLHGIIMYKCDVKK
jgi:hypothetical protein